MRHSAGVSTSSWRGRPRVRLIVDMTRDGSVRTRAFPSPTPRVFRPGSPYHGRMKRWPLALATVCFGCTAKPPPNVATDAEIAALDAVGMEARLASGELSAERVAGVFLARIEASNEAGPSLHAIVEINPDALSIARDLDKRRAASGPVGPLHGLPIVIKASIDTGDAMATTAGSVALARHRAAADALLVARLRAVGAVILAKTNLSEWANFRSTRSTSGWSSVGGQTRNPYVLDRSPCGSSSGSAVAIAAALAPLAIGTETDGSIVCPSASNGVVGIKPTLGLVSGRGIVPIARSQDTAGPIARNVRDAALLLRAIEEPGARPEGHAWPTSALGTTKPSAASGERPLAGVRLGVVRDYTGVGRDGELDAAFGRWLEQLTALGAELVDPIQTGLGEAIESAELTVLLHEFHVQIDEYLHDVRDGPHSLEELIAFDVSHADVAMPIFAQDLFLAAQKTTGLDAPDYREAIASLARFRERLAATFATQRLAAVVAPVSSVAWRIDPEHGDRFSVGSSTIAAVSGYPSIAVPAELLGELPVGLAFIGPPWTEPELTEMASAFEAARGGFPGPRYLPTVGD
jgi:amidase